MWWIFAILSALSQVFRNVIMKDLGHKLDEYINVWGRFTFLLPFALVLSLSIGIPELQPGFWPSSIGAGFFVAISTIFLSKAFKHSDISISIALWKINVIFLLILGVLFLNEEVSYLGVIGIFVTLFGVYLLNINQAKVSLLEPFKLLFKDKGLRYAITAGVILAPASMLFKKTIFLADVYFPIFMNFAFASLFMLPFIIKKSIKSYKIAHQHWYKFLLMGFLAFLTTVTSNNAYKLTVAAYVEAVKQSEIIFALLLGVIFFKEHKRVKEIWKGSLIIICGILILIFTK